MEEEIKKGLGGKSKCACETRPGRVISETICEGGSHASHWKRKHARQRDDIMSKGPEAGKSSLLDLQNDSWSQKRERAHGGPSGGGAVQYQITTSDCGSQVHMESLDLSPGPPVLTWW